MKFRKATENDVLVIVEMIADDELGKKRENFQIPLPSEYLKAFEKISLWISESVNIDNNQKANSKHGRLILVEGHSNSDTDIKFYGGWGTAQMLSTHRKIKFGELDVSEQKEFNLNPLIHYFEKTI